MSAPFILLRICNKYSLHYFGIYVIVNPQNIYSDIHIISYQFQNILSRCFTVDFTGWKI